MLGLDVGGIQVNCHFFVEEQIEFDIDPRQVTDEVRFDHLCRFMQWLGRGARRDVILTPEGGEQEVIIRYETGRDSLEYTPVGLPQMRSDTRFS